MRAKTIICETHAELQRRLKERPRASMPPQEERALRQWTIARYSEAIEADPSFAAAYVERGAELYFCDRYEEAAADMRRAFELRPDQAELYERMAYPFEGEEARQILQAGMELAAPGSIQQQNFRMNCIRTYWHEGELAKYVQLLEEWISQFDLEPFMYSLALDGLARGYSALGEHEKAEATYRAELNATPQSNSGLVAQMIVRTWMHREDYQNARRTLKEFAHLIPPDERTVLEAVLAILAAPASATARNAGISAIEASESMVARRGPPSAKTNYFTFLVGVLYFGVGRTEEARKLLLGFAKQLGANETGWGVTLRWEIAKARNLAGMR